MKAEAIARALGGRRAGAGWIARCPAHDDREPSLSIADGENGNVLVYCHAGCEQHRVIAALRLRGIWNGALRRRGSRLSAASRCRTSGTHHQLPNRRASALAHTEEARQIAENVTGLFSILAEWSRAEIPTPANDAGKPAASDDKEARHDR